MPASLQLALPCVISSRVALPIGQVSSWATDPHHVLWDHLKLMSVGFLFCAASPQTVL